MAFQHQLNLLENCKLHFCKVVKLKILKHLYTCKASVESGNAGPGENNGTESLSVMSSKVGGDYVWVIILLYLLLRLNLLAEAIGLGEKSPSLHGTHGIISHHMRL